MVPRRRADIHKLILSVLCILVILNRLHTIFLSSYNLNALGIRESLVVIRNAKYLVMCSGVGWQVGKRRFGRCLIVGIVKGLLRNRNGFFLCLFIYNG